MPLPSRLRAGPTPKCFSLSTLSPTNDRPSPNYFFPDFRRPRIIRSAPESSATALIPEAALISGVGGGGGSQGRCRCADQPQSQHQRFSQLSTLFLTARIATTITSRIFAGLESPGAHRKTGRGRRRPRLDRSRGPMGRRRRLVPMRRSRPRLRSKISSFLCHAPRHARRPAPYFDRLGGNSWGSISWPLRHCKFFSRKCPGSAPEVPERGRRNRRTGTRGSNARNLPEVPLAAE